MSLETQIEENPKLKRGKNVLVGISGIDGSGKSTYAQALKRSLQARGLAIGLVASDNFFHPKPVRNANPDQITGYFDESFDFRRLVDKVLNPIRHSTAVTTKLPVLDLVTDEQSERMFQFSGPGVVIVEGVFLFRRELQSHFDLKIWLDVTFETAESRVVARPRDRRHGDADEIRRRYNERYFAAQRHHIERDRPAEAADIVIANE